MVDGLNLNSDVKFSYQRKHSQTMACSSSRRLKKRIPEVNQNFTVTMRASANGHSYDTRACRVAKFHLQIYHMTICNIGSSFVWH
jgi:hypothetical protein